MKRQTQKFWFHYRNNFIPQLFLSGSGYMSEDLGYTLRPYPKYGDNHIEKDIVFDTDKTSATFGCSYYFTKQHKAQERNRFLYKLVNDLNTDNMELASRSCTSSSYSTLSYRSVFDDYYYPMPVTFKEVHENDIKPELCAPKDYGFVKHNPPFEQRIQKTKECGAALKLVNEKLLPYERKLARSLKHQKGKEL